MNHAVRENMLRRAADFIFEQLGERNIRAIYGDSDGSDVYFYSTIPLEGYEKNGGVYVRNARSPDSWSKDALDDVRSRFAANAKYYSEETKFKEWKNGILVKDERRKRIFSPAETELMRAAGSYAWNHSIAFFNTVDPERCLNEYERMIFEFPDDYISCHEDAHDAMSKHSAIFDRQGRDSNLVEEGVAQMISNAYIGRYYPHLMERLKTVLLSIETDRIHTLAFQMAFEEDKVLKRIQAEIKARNSGIN